MRFCRFISSMSCILLDFLAQRRPHAPEVTQTGQDGGLCLAACLVTSDVPCCRERQPVALEFGKTRSSGPLAPPSCFAVERSATWHVRCGDGDAVLFRLEAFLFCSSAASVTRRLCFADPWDTLSVKRGV